MAGASNVGDGWLIQGWWGGSWESGIYLRDWGESERTQFVCTSYSTIRGRRYMNLNMSSG